MTLPQDRSDAELLGATEDRDAFAVFYRRHVRAVIRFCAGRAAPDEVADLVSEVFATALVHRRRFDQTRGSGIGWLLGIARNKLAEAHRRGAVQARTYQRLGGQLLTLDGAELASTLDDEGLLQGLPDEQRRAVRARVLRDESFEQIAAAEHVSAAAVRQRVSRGLRTLRSQYDKDDG